MIKGGASVGPSGSGLSWVNVTVRFPDEPTEADAAVCSSGSELSWIIVTMLRDPEVLVCSVASTAVGSSGSALSWTTDAALVNAAMSIGGGGGGRDRNLEILKHISPVDMFMSVVSEMSIAITVAARGGVKENRLLSTVAAYGEGMPNKAPAAALVKKTSWLLFSVTPTLGM